MSIDTWTLDQCETHSPGGVILPSLDDVSMGVLILFRPLSENLKIHTQYEDQDYCRIYSGLRSGLVATAM